MGVRSGISYKEGAFWAPCGPVQCSIWILNGWGWRERERKKEGSLKEVSVFRRKMDKVRKTGIARETHNYDSSCFRVIVVWIFCYHISIITRVLPAILLSFTILSIILATYKNALTLFVDTNLLNMTIIIGKMILTNCPQSQPPYFQ